MAGYKVSENAVDDLYRLWLYGVENWGMTKADSYVLGFYQKFELIAEQPLLFSAVDHIRIGYRRCPHERESIYYRIQGDVVEIMGIIGQQDLDNWI